MPYQYEDTVYDTQQYFALCYSRIWKKEGTKIIVEFSRKIL